MHALPATLLILTAAMATVVTAPSAEANHCVAEVNGAVGVGCVYYGAAFCAAYVGDDHLVCNSQLERVCLVNTDGVCVYL